VCTALTKSASVNDVAEPVAAVETGKFGRNPCGWPVPEPLTNEAPSSPAILFPTSSARYASKATPASVASLISRDVCEWATSLEAAEALLEQVLEDAPELVDVLYVASVDLAVAPN
jgi:hypothetical protein